jgi:hypothetical protein
MLVAMHWDVGTREWCTNGLRCSWTFVLTRIPDFRRELDLGGHSSRTYLASRPEQGTRFEGKGPRLFGPLLSHRSSRSSVAPKIEIQLIARFPAYGGRIVPALAGSD